MLTAAAPIQLTPKQFERIRLLVHKQAGIHLKPGKEELVKMRLTKRIGELGLAGFDDYVDLVQRDRSRGELITMLDALTTNKTSFFREEEHFRFMRHEIFPRLDAQRVIRFWSAGCSSGEEPVTIAIETLEALRGAERRDIKILATDLSTRILERAKTGTFDAETVSSIPKAVLQRHFMRVDPRSGSYRINDKIRRMIAYARLNLMGTWPMKGPFHVIFCRNVMIYFDKPTQERLVNRFAELLIPGGYLLIGHSESLTGLSHPYRFIRPAVYQKN